ncbi:ATP-binding protein [Streptomyces tricolor]|uniref:ATP-binding protein n=1 Tax=Streptomyces tricolor TaxID=68277 RepID=UPI0036E7C019
MPTPVHRFVLAGIESEVPPARRQIVDQVRAWGVPLDEETADAVRLVVSELITNVVVHGAGPITVTLFYRPGRLVIDVLDDDPSVRRTGGVQAEDENGRGLALARLLSCAVLGSLPAPVSVYGPRWRCPWRWRRARLSLDHVACARCGPSTGMGPSPGR